MIYRFNFIIYDFKSLMILKCAYDRKSELAIPLSVSIVNNKYNSKEIEVYLDSLYWASFHII